MAMDACCSVTQNDPHRISLQIRICEEKRRNFIEMMMKEKVEKTKK